MSQTTPFIFIICLIFSYQISSQDIYFSQFNNAPLTINPATIGAFNGDYRIRTHYENRSSTILRGDAYNYYALTFDTKFDVTERSFIGVGLIGQIDQSGELNYGSKQYKIGASFNHRLKSTANTHHNIALGFDFGIVNRKINLTHTRWPSQFDQNGEFDPTTIIDIDFIDPDIVHGDITMGLLWQSDFNNKHALNIGFAMHHITKPQVSFLLDSSAKLNIRYNLNIGGEVGVASNLAILPSLFYIKQGPHDQFVVGGSAKWYFDQNRNKSIQFGYWNKSGEVYNGTFAATLHLNKIMIGLSLDGSSYQLQTLEVVNNSYQISIGYIFTQQVSNRSIFERI